MFVSLYSTYVNTSNPNKNSDLKNSDSKNNDNSFKDSFLDTKTPNSYSNKNLPINYISNYKVFHNQQKLQEHSTNQNEFTLKQLNTLKSAKIAYEENTKMFSIVKKPSPALSYLPKIDEKLSPEIKEAKEKNLRYAMVNTYMENDKYYRIASAA